MCLSNFIIFSLIEIVIYIKQTRFPIIRIAAQFLKKKNIKNLRRIRLRLRGYHKIFKEFARGSGYRIKANFEYRVKRPRAKGAKNVRLPC